MLITVPSKIGSQQTSWQKMVFSMANLTKLWMHNICDQVILKFAAVIYRYNNL